METVVQLGNGEQTTSVRMSCSGSAYSKSVERRMKLRLRFYHTLKAPERLSLQTFVTVLIEGHSSPITEWIDNNGQSQAGSPVCPFPKGDSGPH